KTQQPGRGISSLSEPLESRVPFWLEQPSSQKLQRWQTWGAEGPACVLSWRERRGSLPILRSMPNPPLGLSLLSPISLCKKASCMTSLVLLRSLLEKLVFSCCSIGFCEDRCMLPADEKRVTRGAGLGSSWRIGTSLV